MFCLWSLACALAPNWPALLIFRVLVGIFASSPLSAGTGVMTDIYPSAETRGRAMTLYMVNYGPVLLVYNARHLRAEDPTEALEITAAHEDVDLNTRQLATSVLSRPLAMLFGESIVTATCAYLALCYAIFYMTFQAFPIINVDLYGLSLGVEGLCFLTIGLGAFCGVPVFLGWDAYLKGEVRDKSGQLFVARLFWLSCSARDDVSVWVVVWSGVPFGMGFMLIFMALMNYLTDASEIYAASANAAASCSRSLLATVLPFASTPMFARLGIAGACSLLPGLSCVMCVVPFVFIWKGEWLRATCHFCRMLKAARDEGKASGSVLN